MERRQCQYWNRVIVHSLRYFPICNLDLRLKLGLTTTCNVRFVNETIRRSLFLSFFVANARILDEADEWRKIIYISISIQIFPRTFLLTISISLTRKWGKRSRTAVKIEKRVESIYNIIAEHALLRFCNLYAQSNHFVREIRETKGKKEREKKKKIECCEYSRASCIISRLRGK